MSVVSTNYGYRVTGSSDLTTISTSTVVVKSFVYIPAADNNVCAMTDKSGNILTNSSVETWSAGDNVAPDGWATEGIAGVTATIAKEATIVKDGSFSAKLTCSAGIGGLASLYQAVPLTYAGRLLYFCGYAYATTAGVNIGISTRTGGTENFFWSSAHSGGSSWEYLYLSLSIPPTVNFWIRVRCAIQSNAGGSRTGYFDKLICVSDIVHNMKGAVANTSYTDRFGNKGTRFDGLKILMGDVNDVLHIHVR